MRKSLLALLVTSLVMLGVTTVSSATTPLPTNRVFPLGVSDYRSAVSVAKAFGLNIGIPPRVPYFESTSGKESGPDWIEVVTNGPTYVSYIHTHETDGHWYVVSMTSPIIRVITPADGSRVGSRIEVRALGLSTVKYFASAMIYGNLEYSGAFLKKSKSSYTGRTTSIGPDNEVGVYYGKFSSDLTGTKNGWFMVAALSPVGDGLLAAVITHDRG
jgi:hypothetical protein